MSNTYVNDIWELEKKLEKLHQFSSETSELFRSSLNDMKIAMQSVTVLTNTIVNSDGTYQFKMILNVFPGWMPNRKAFSNCMYKNNFEIICM